MSRTYHHQALQLVNKEFQHWLNEIDYSCSAWWQDGRHCKFKVPHKLKRYENHWLHWSMKTPSWWHTLHHRRPRRRKDKHLCHMVVIGSVEPDSALFSLNSKPEVWYW